MRFRIPLIPPVIYCEHCLLLTR